MRVVVLKKNKLYEAKFNKKEIKMIIIKKFISLKIHFINKNIVDNSNPIKKTYK